MTREEAIEVLENGGWWDSLIPVTTIEGRIEDDQLHEALDLALSALRPVSREQVEKVWRGEWIGMTDDDGCTWLECSRCEYGLDSLEEPNHFCPACGSPMDDEAVDILYNNLKKLFEQEDS